MTSSNENIFHVPGHYDVIVMYIIHMQQFNHTWDNKNASFQSYLCGKGCYNVISLQCRHNGRDGVSNHQPHDCLLNRLLRRRSKRTWRLSATGLCVGNSPVTSEFPAQMASNAKKYFHLMTSSCNVLLFHVAHMYSQCEYIKSHNRL